MPQRVIELVAGSEAVDAVITLALIGSPSSGRAGRQNESGGGRVGEAPGERVPTLFAELNELEEALVRHIGDVMQRTGKPVISVPLTPVQRSVFAGLGRFAPVLLPNPQAAVRALAGAEHYPAATIPVQKPIRQTGSTILSQNKRTWFHDTVQSMCLA